MSKLPLFPLNTVLFPGMVLPLHVFEDRYKQMIGACLEDDSGFGVVLIRSGEEAARPVSRFEEDRAMIAGRPPCAPRRRPSIIRPGWRGAGGVPQVLRAAVPTHVGDRMFPARSLFLFGFPRFRFPRLRLRVDEAAPGLSARAWPLARR